MLVVASRSSCGRSATIRPHRRSSQLLRDRAHSTQELAEKLGHPEGHRRPSPEGARDAPASIHVVRTRKVRAMTEKFYGRTARLFLFQTEDPAGRPGDRRRHPPPRRERGSSSAPTRRRASASFARAREDGHATASSAALKKLIDDFRAADTPDGEPYALVDRACTGASGCRRLRRPTRRALGAPPTS